MQYRIVVFLNFLIDKLRQWTHIVGHVSHKGIAQGAFPAPECEDVNKGEK